jgi:hypothetical protein
MDINLKSTITLAPDLMLPAKRLLQYSYLIKFIIYGQGNTQVWMNDKLNKIVISKIMSTYFIRLNKNALLLCVLVNTSFS